MEAVSRKMNCDDAVDRNMNEIKKWNVTIK